MKIKAFLAARPQLAPCLIAAVMLLLAVGRWPYDYYRLLRWVVCAAAVYVAWWGWSTERPWMAWVWGVIAVTYNPVIPIHLKRQIWQVLDVAGAVLFARAAFLSGDDDKGEGIHLSSEGEDGNEAEGAGDTPKRSPEQRDNTMTAQNSPNGLRGLLKTALVHANRRKGLLLAGALIVVAVGAWLVQVASSDAVYQVQYRVMSTADTSEEIKVEVRMCTPKGEEERIVTTPYASPAYTFNEGDDVSITAIDRQKARHDANHGLLVEINANGETVRRTRRLTYPGGYRDVVSASWTVPGDDVIDNGQMRR